MNFRKNISKSKDKESWDNSKQLKITHPVHFISANVVDIYEKKLKKAVSDVMEKVLDLSTLRSSGMNLVIGMIVAYLQI